MVGAAGWYRKFIPNFSEIVAPLNELYRGNLKGRAKIEWRTQADTAFETFKKKLTTAPILTMCDYSLPFKIYCDASLVAAGAVLTQKFEGEKKVIRYFSKKFTRPETNYSATERECLAVILSVEKFRPYIDGVKFTVVTDHAALKWLMGLKDPSGRLARWAIRLQAYEMEIVHKPGKHMELPDALSRAMDLIDIKAETTSDSWYNSTKERTLKSELDRFKVENGLLYHRLKLTAYGGQRLWTVLFHLNNEVKFYSSIMTIIHIKGYRKFTDASNNVTTGLEVVFVQNGCPELIITDNGSQFTSHSFERMCKENGTELWKTPVDSPGICWDLSMDPSLRRLIKCCVEWTLEWID